MALGGLSEVMANHIKKGDKFGINGRLQIRKWEKDNGEKQYFTEVIVNGFDFPDKKKQEQPSNNQPKTKVSEDPFQGNGSINYPVTMTLPF
jgi:single-strand DNA-binding protein